MEKEELLIQIKKMRKSLESLQNSNSNLKDSLNKNAVINGRGVEDSELGSISSDVTKMIDSINQELLPLIQEKM